MESRFAAKSIDQKIYRLVAGRTCCDGSSTFSVITVVVVVVTVAADTGVLVTVTVE